MKEKPRIINIRSLLQETRLSIPDYQRPYKWGIKNVNQLIDDILLQRNKSAYRIGTIVLHHETKSTDQGKLDKLNIVDGQQRSITIFLIALALRDYVQDAVKNEMRSHHYEMPEIKIFETVEFPNPISQRNIYQNFREIKRRIVDFNLESIRFFFEKCEMVRVELDDISEAFQFFDSQNSRGKDLDPHDLLKAFHLRELSKNTSEQDKIYLIEWWEKLETDDIKALFSSLLFRVRNWANGESARFFSKDDVDIFKGINVEFEATYPYAELHKIGHFFVEGYNYNYQRKIDYQKLAYPFQLNQVMVNGKRFFEFVEHYWNVREEMYKRLKKDDSARAIIDVIDSYEKRFRTGDKYVRNLFDCALLFYWDKFGENEIGRVAEKLYIWAYKLRLEQSNVQLASVDNYALKSPFVFNLINKALRPKEVLDLPLEVISESKIVRKELKEIKKLFQNLNYYES